MGSFVLALLARDPLWRRPIARQSISEMLVAIGFPSMRAHMESTRH